MINCAKVRKTNRETVVVNYPKAELKELKAFCENYGSKKVIQDDAKLANKTLNRILETGKAQIGSIDKIRKALANFKEEATKKNIA
ncbi:MAG: hypothetical protein BGO31_15595 [Bacteroidetes bacterium 43-16]|nr:MAG: hypothetical protein BGO31_15595 [Bacteroidetes bacterium 43-16]